MAAPALGPGRACGGAAGFHLHRQGDYQRIFPFGATMISDGVAEVCESDATGKADIGHGYTYSSHLVGAAAALACLAETQRLQVQINAAQRGAELHAGLLALKDKYEVIGDVRGGHGLMHAVELVSDRATKKPTDKTVPAKLQAVAYQEEAMVRVSGNNIIMSPPLVVTSADVGVILAALEAGLAA